MAINAYRSILSAAASPRAEPMLFAVSFAESSFFPLPPDVMLGPMCSARPERAWRYALVCTLASVLGGLLGYAIGYALFQSVGSWIISVFGYGGREQELRAFYDQYGALAIFIKGLTPIPFKLVTIISGAMHFSLPVFVVACLITRGARFFLVAWLFRTYGPSIAPVIEKRIGVVMLGVAIVLVAAILAVRFLH
ncbi:DedA family protein [bacterium]|nr:DedA family protein [bacterium]